MLYSIELWVGVAIGVLSTNAVFLTGYLFQAWCDAKQITSGIEFLQVRSMELKKEGVGRVKRTGRL